MKNDSTSCKYKYVCSINICRTVCGTALVRRRGESRDTRVPRLHNTSPYTGTVRRTLIIYLLQFRLFSSIFHNSAPHSHPARPPPHGRSKKNSVRVCIERPTGPDDRGGRDTARLYCGLAGRQPGVATRRPSRTINVHLDILMQLTPVRIGRRGTPISPAQLFL